MDGADDEPYEKKLQAVLVVLSMIVVISAGYFIYSIIYLSDNSEYERITQPGELAKDYLQNGTYSEILIEVDFVEGFAPGDDAMETLTNMLDRHCDKNTIVTELSDTINEPDVMDVYNVNDIYNLEKKYRNHRTGNGVVVMYILFLNGFYEGSDATLGVSYQGSSFAIFKEKVEGIEIPHGIRQYVSQSDFENAVVVHEAGHLLGLVNIHYTSETDHEGPESAHHCIHEECAMYHALEHSRQSYMEKIFEGGSDNLKPPVVFCEDCEEDLNNIKSDVY